MPGPLDLDALDALYEEAQKRSLDTTDGRGWYAYASLAKTLADAYPALRDRIRELEERLASVMETCLLPCWEDGHASVKETHSDHMLCCWCEQLRSAHTLREQRQP